MGYIGSKPANKAITSADIEDNAVTSAKIDTDTIVAGDLAANSVDSSELVDGSIDTSHIGALQVTRAKLAADAIDGTKLADDAINSEHYTDGSIDTAHIDSLQVTTAKIAADAVTAAKLADDAVVTANIVDLNVTTGKLAADAVTAAKIADDAIGAEHIDDNAIGLAALASGTDGNIISYDASGNPVAIATGNDGQILTSAGAGQPPAFEAAPAGFDVSSITGATAMTTHPTPTDEYVVSDGGTLKRVDAAFVGARPCFRGRFTSGFNACTGVWNTIPITSTDDFDGCFNETGSSVTLNGLTVPAYAFCPNHVGRYIVHANALIWSTSYHGTNGTNSYVHIGTQWNGGGRYFNTWHNHFRSSIYHSSTWELNGTGDYLQFILSPGTDFGSVQNFYAEGSYNWYSIWKLPSVPKNASAE